MEPDRWQRVTAIFEQALERDGEARLAFVRDACAGDAELQREVEVMLSSHDEAGSFLSASPASPSAAASSKTPALTPGTRVGPYEVTVKIGEGGMGEVYRARDTRLDRDVALKVLPSAFTDDPERLARFEREAKVLASLNHPNIAGIHGLEESDGVRGLALELVEGPTLADRLAQGPIPISEALAVARQVVDALEAAHAQGVIHRDLKPGNIKIRPDGAVKILDFGLAKAVAGDGDADELANSPTITALATRDGVLLGTAAYMSPEQARGQVVDRRTDIWAFGCVLFEMLTGHQAFAGSTTSDVLSAVLTSEPPYDSLPDTVSPSLSLFLRRCLRKDLHERIRDIGDVGLALAGAFDIVATADDAVSTRHRTTALTGLVGVVGGVVAAAGIWYVILENPQIPADAFTVSLPEGVRLADSLWKVATLSPDGRDMVYVGARDESTQLYHRPLAELDAVPIGGTEGATSPAFAPSGEGLVFQADHSVRRVSLSGGPASTICPLPSDIDIGDATLAWSPDGTIWIGSRTTGLYRVPVTGGVPRSVTTLDAAAGERGHLSPYPLPNGRGVLYTSFSGGERVSVMLFDTETGDSHRLAEGRRAEFSTTGHVLFSGSELITGASTLWAMPFDEGRLEQTGEAVPVLEGMARFAFHVGSDGTLVYVAQSASVSQRTLTWVDMAGIEAPIPAPAGVYYNPRLSPDGTRVLVIGAGDNWDILIYDFARGDQTRVTRNASIERVAVWMPNGDDVLFASNRNGSYDLFVKPASGAGSASLWYENPERDLYPWAWASSGDTLLASDFALAGNTGFDIGAIDVDPRDARRPVIEDVYIEGVPTVSPDGRWLAYGSNESGQMEIYVSPYPDVTRDRVKVSTNGGYNALWAPDGERLFYRMAEPGCGTPVSPGDCRKWMMSVAIDSSSSLIVGTPEALFEDPHFSDIGRHYDVTPDGERFIMLKRAAETQPQLNVARSWVDSLSERVPVN